MTFYYEDPSGSDLEAVRFRLQDTDEDRPLLTDEEIEFELAEASDDVLAATLACAEALVARGSHKVTKKIGDRQIDYSNLISQYQSLANTLRDKIQRGDFGYTIPEAGKVADTENYPIAFEPTDIAPQDWEA